MTSRRQTRYSYQTPAEQSLPLGTVYQALYGPKVTVANCRTLATDLSTLAGRDEPWSWKHIHSLIKDYNGFKMTTQMQRAAETLLRMQQGADPLAAQMHPTRVLALHELPPDTWVLAKSRRCARPGCQVHFVAERPDQQYHSEECRRAAQAETGDKEQL